MTDIYDQADDFCHKWREMDVIYEECAKAVGMSYSSLYALTIIYLNDGACTQKAIGEETFLPKQTVNAIIRGFYDQGYIKMVEDDADRRNKNISLTKKGKVFADGIIPKITEAEKKAMASLGEKRRQLLIECTEQYVSSFRASMSECFRLGETPPPDS